MAERGGPGGAADASAADWIAVAAGSLGALMATLDISITNSALPQIQGEIGATGTEGTWISTGYLMSEIVMIPLTAWLTRVFGLRKLLLACARAVLRVLDDVRPVAYPGQMIIGRIGQGFSGGAMIPTAQTIVRTRLPRHQMPVGMTLFGLIVLLGPLLGPVVGGWLAENIELELVLLRQSARMRGADLPAAVRRAACGQGRTGRNSSTPTGWASSGLAAGLSSLTVVLEEGQRERWFESRMIVWLSIVAAIGMALMAVAQFTAEEPIIRLELFANGPMPA